MSKNNWIKGALILGFSFFIAIFLVKPIGVSTQFSVLSGIIHSSIDKNVIVVQMPITIKTMGNWQKL